MHHLKATTARDLEKYSSAVTLSDMEIFIFPELLYSLVLANIMSPKVWAWREHAWFKDIGKMTPYRRVLRLKQFIIDHYEFNLDLDTWGLTTKEKEVARFSPFMDEKIVSESNALFGYEGDKYYFELDIRKHFGLDKYTSNVIPYWKTETIEAMDAFLHKPGYSTGAGECVSLSTLYAAAMFIVCGIPLEQIFLLATPLHSQNFIDVSDGILTNNRRVVTKNMWFNGTELTAKAQRALRHEQITMVAHNTGYLHVVYPQATINPKAYQRVQQKLRTYLKTDISMEILTNYLRENSKLQTCFQIIHNVGGKQRYIAAERVYGYEHTSSFKVSDKTREKLLEEIDEDEYFPHPIEGRIPLNKFDTFFRENKIDLDNMDDIMKLKKEFNCYNTKACDIIRDIIRFTRLEPQWPDHGQTREYIPSEPILLTNAMSREEVIAYVESMRPRNPSADLAFYAYRDLSRTGWAPFLKAALERNPVSIKGAEGKEDAQVADYLSAMPAESIYDGPRMAQPDEVWNYGRGDGLEKALCLANILKARHLQDQVRVECRGGTTVVSTGSTRVEWKTTKGLELSQAW
ncbi:MAG: hypothetical protein V2A34_00465 [Lentisphaerota bacterium]